MSDLTRKRLRLAVDITDYGEFADVLNNKPPEAWAANDLTLEIGLLVGKTVADVSDVTSVVVQLKDKDDLAGDPVLAGSTTDITTDLTQSQWDGKAAGVAHAVIHFTAGQMNLNLGSGATNKAYHLVVMVTSDSGAKLITAGVSTLTVRDDGFNYAAETDREWRTRNGVLQLKNSTTGEFHSITLDTVEGAATLQINQTGEVDDGWYDDGFVAPPDDGSWRSQDGMLQLKNATTGLYHSLTADTVAGVVTLIIEQTGEA